MVKRAKTDRKLRFYDRKYYVYPGNNKGSLDITEAKVLSKEAFEKEYCLRKGEKYQKTMMEGTLLMTKKKYSEAIKMLNQVFNKKDASNWYTKGNILCNLNKKKEALKCYDESLFLDTHYIKAWYRKGWLLFHNKNYKDAGKCFENVVELEESKKKKERLVKNNWLVSGIFSCMVSWISENNKLTHKGKPSKKIYDKAGYWVGVIYTLFTHNIALYEDDDGQTVGTQIAPSRMNETEFVDYCFKHMNEILDTIEPSIIATITIPGQKH
tara:strand:- start:226 stop:1029 length:804 start_codon:yes stop_codon:yes gene_type:complete